MVVATGITGAVTMALLDRLMKVIVQTHPAFGGVIVDGLLQIRRAENVQLAFSLPFPFGLALALSVVVIFLFGWWWVLEFQKGATVIVVGLTFVLSGAISNFMDRVRWGYVVDYLDVPWFTVFNLADVLITIGVVLIVLRELVRWLRGGGRKH